jgi:adenylate kinase
MAVYSIPLSLFEGCRATLNGKPGPMLMLGPPGSGKGTQSSEVASRWRVPRISTGDLLRFNVSRWTHLGRFADGFMKSGRLVPDELISDMVAERLANADTLRGFVLDGFPRTVRQAIWLDELLGKQSEVLPPIMISFRVDLDRLISRVVGRKICPVCGSTYHDVFCPPQLTGTCNRDGAPLEQRADDTLEVMHKRLKVYQAQTKPIIERYQSSRYFSPIDGDRPISEVTETIVRTIRHVRGLQV